MKNQILLIYFLIAWVQYSCYSQNRWVKQYNEGLNAFGSGISSSYDNGYILAGLVLPNYKYSWLIKTDVNGEILWEKFIGGNHDRVIVDCFSQNRFGETYLAGGIYDDGNTDPFILKLNACGEMEWCQSFSSTENSDFYCDVIITPEGGCAALVIQSFPNNIYQTGIIRFSPDGDLFWQKYYQSSDQGVWDEELIDLILTPDSGFLLTGSCYYPDPDDPDLYWLHPYYDKTDSLGNFEWETIVHKETADMGGEAWETIVNHSKEYYYSCINHNYHTNNSYSRLPALVKIDLDGNVIDVYDLVHEDYDWGSLQSAVFINDTLLAGGATWFNNEDPPISRAVIFDTLGNIRDSLTLLNTGWLSNTALTNDGKLLFYNTIEEDGDFDTYLFKLTQDLEQDTFYTTPFIYDSLCPYKITSDTIVPDDCEVIVGIEEPGSGDMETGGQGEEGKKGGLEIWPNPASGVIHGRLNMDELHGRLNMDDGRLNRDLTLVIYDIFGREVQKIDVQNKQNEVQLNVESFSPGVYIAILKNGLDILESRKFIIAR